MIVSEQFLKSSQSVAPPSKVNARVVFLTHYIPLYQVRVLQELARQVRDFHVLLSTPIEPNREFQPDWSGLNVTVQKTLTFRQKWRHADQKNKFSDQLYVHVPTDTSQRLRELNPDVVMSLELGARSLGAIRYCQRNAKSKSLLCTYMSEHTEKSRGWLRSRVRRWLIDRADALTFNGPSCKSYLESYGVDANRLFHLPYAADDRTTFQGDVQRDDASTRNKLLCVGQLTERKGVEILLQQLSDFCHNQPNRRLEITFVGTGPLEESIRHHSLPENLSLQLLGGLSPSEVTRQLSRTGAVIAPTLADEWMLVVNEALHAGVPVIGSQYAQATTTLIRDGFNGWRYDPVQAQSLTNALNAYLDLSSEDLRQMRVNAQGSVRQRTPAWAASGAVEAIRSLVGKNRECQSSANPTQDG